MKVVAVLGPKPLLRNRKSPSEKAQAFLWFETTAGGYAELSSSVLGAMSPEKSAVLTPYSGGPSRFQRPASVPTPNLAGSLVADSRWRGVRW